MRRDVLGREGLGHGAVRAAWLETAVSFRQEDSWAGQRRRGCGGDRRDLALYALWSFSAGGVGAQRSTFRLDRLVEGALRDLCRLAWWCTGVVGCRGNAVTPLSIGVGISGLLGQDPCWRIDQRMG